MVDDHHSVIEELRERNVNSIYGDATDPAVLIQAHIHEAAILVLAIENEILCRKIVETAKILRPTIETVMPAENEEDAKALRRTVLLRLLYRTSSWRKPSFNSR